MVFIFLKYLFSNLLYKFVFNVFIYYGHPSLAHKLGKFNFALFCFVFQLGLFKHLCVPGAWSNAWHTVGLLLNEQGVLSLRGLQIGYRSSFLLNPRICEFSPWELIFKIRLTHTERSVKFKENKTDSADARKYITLCYYHYLSAKCPSIIFYYIFFFSLHLAYMSSWCFSSLCKLAIEKIVNWELSNIFFWWRDSQIV